MEIEPFRIEEYDELIALWERSGLPFDKADRDSRDKIEKQTYDDHVVILTLKDNGRMIGAVIGSSDGRKGWINRLVIEPEYRGRKLAERLLERTEEALIEMGVDYFSALIEDKNFPSMALFRRNGYDPWDDIVYFSKRLNKKSTGC
ncbi:MAG: GNAT family N-acetyltransferase [Candidatus Zixiibacteriota bacterium]